MCGIALTLAYAAPSDDAAAVASGSADARTATASHWSSVAEIALTPRGPDVQRSVTMTMHRTIDGAAPAVVALSATVLHLRGASSTPTPQPIHDPAGSGNVLCWNGELYALRTERLPEPMRTAASPAWPQIARGQNDTAFVMALLCRIDRECEAEDASTAPSSSAATAAAAPPRCGDFGTQLSWLLSAIDGPFSFVFYRARFGQLWYGRDRLGRRSLVSAQRRCEGAAGLHVLHISSVALQPDVHAAAADGAQWAEVGVTGVWCIQLHGAAPSRDAAVVQATVDAAVVASAASASATVAASPSLSSVDPEDGPIVASVPTAVPAIGAPFTLLHYPYPHLHPHLGSVAADAAADSTAAASDGSSASSAVAFDAPSSPQLQLPCVARLAHSFATGIQLSTDIAPFERPLGRATSQQLEALASGAQELNASIPAAMHGLPPAAKMLYAALHRSMALRIQSICTAPSASSARVGVLFSGGLDCMVLAFLAHRLLPPGEPIDLINVAFSGHLSAAAVEKFVPDRVTAINGWRELRSVSAREASQSSAEANGSLSSAAAAASSASASPIPQPQQPHSPPPHSPRHWNLILVDVSLSMLETHRARILELLHPRDTVMDFNIASILYFGSRAKGRLHQDPPAPAATMAVADADDGRCAPALSASAIAGPHEPATSVDLIQSRLSRLGTTKVAFDSAAVSSSDVAHPVSLRSKAAKKGRVLPPELMAKIAAGGAPTTASFAHSQAKAAAAVSAAAGALNDDDAAPTTSPDADAEAEDPASASPPCNGVPLTKADRRSAKHRERNLIRKFFKAQASASVRQDMEDMMPTAADFRSADDIAAEVASAAAGGDDASSAACSFTSQAKVLLLGIGADELMAGYGRHRTVWINARGGGRREREAEKTQSQQPQKSQNEPASLPAAADDDDAANAASPSSRASSPVASPSPSPAPTFDADLAAWSSLRAELARDFHRLWVRNLGRDDRVVAASGREARHPFLDESLLALIHRSLPLECVASMQQPAGVGDKMILRQVAASLGLSNAARLVKRAMQFGARIANKKVAGYVRMDAAVRCEDVVNPCFLRAAIADPAAAAGSGAPSNRPFVASAPHASLDKRVQKANKKLAHAKAAATAAASSSVSPPTTSASASSAPAAAPI